MAIFSTKIPRNATNVSILSELLYLDEENVDFADRNLTFQSIEGVEFYQPSIRISYTVIREDGAEISVSRVTT